MQFDVRVVHQPAGLIDVAQVCDRVDLAGLQRDRLHGRVRDENELDRVEFHIQPIVLVALETQSLVGTELSQFERATADGVAGETVVTQDFDRFLWNRDDSCQTVAVQQERIRSGRGDLKRVTVKRLYTLDVAKREGRALVQEAVNGVDRK